MLTRIVWMLLTTGCLVAQIAIPEAGVVRDRRGVLRPLLGVAGSFHFGDAIATGVVAAGASKNIAFAKTTSELLVIRGGVVIGTHAAPEGPAEFVFGESVYVYFPALRERWTWRDGEFEKEHNAAPSDVVERAEGDEVALADGRRVRIADRIESIERVNGEWLIARCEGALYAVRTSGSTEVVQLPEAAE